jgi:hypothetical protein
VSVDIYGEQWRDGRIDRCVVVNGDVYLDGADAAAKARQVAADLLNAADKLEPPTGLPSSSRFARLLGAGRLALFGHGDNTTSALLVTDTAAPCHPLGDRPTWGRDQRKATL